MKVQSIYTEKNDCQDCYKCVRRCPVKAIKIEDHSASIVSELCINCGYCTTICPAGAKKIRNDYPEAKKLISSGKKTIAAIAPSWYSEFTEYDRSTFVQTLKHLGFSEVSEVALGAEMVSESVESYLKEVQTGIHISSCCPTVVSLIQKYYPQHINKITPILTPMQAHAQFLRSIFEEDINIVFVGPCIAKKNEAEDYTGFIDVAISFLELKAWLEEDVAFQASKSETHQFFPHSAADGSLYPIDGGMIKSIKANSSTVDLDFMSFSGRNSVKDVLNSLENLDSEKLCFLELLSCNGGCINGPGCSEKNSIIRKRTNIIESHHKYAENHRIIKSNTNRNLSFNASCIKILEHKEQEIKEALKSIGKITDSDELNCSGCGYENCKDFAKALLDGKAESSMCVSYMRKLAQNKASVLLQKMPYGVVICDENLKIIESNKHFAQLLGKEIYELFDDIPGLEGANLKLVFPAFKLFKNAIQLGLEYFEKDILLDNKPFHLSLFSIQKQKIVCGILRNLQQPEVQKDEIIKRTKEVIYENLFTVQKVASLLGENAAKTEGMLNTIIQSYQNPEDV